MSAFQGRNGRSKVIWLVAVTLAVVAGTLAAFDRLTAGPAFTQEFTLTTAADFLGGAFYRTGIVNNAGGEVELLPIGVAGLWVTDTQQLPASRSQLAVAAYGGRIYALGGSDGFVPTAQVYVSSVSNDNLTGWSTQAYSMPFGLAGHLAFAAAPGGQPYLYAVGGYLYPSFQISNRIFYAPINGDGSVGAWLTNTVNLPVALSFPSGVIFNNRMYVIGGTDTGGIYRSEAYSAPLSGDGSVGAWRAEASLPQPLARTAAVVFSGAISNTIYVLGGATSAVTNTLNVYFADITGGGALTPWQTSNGNLPNAFSSHAAVQYNGQIYIIGGNTGGDSTNLQPRKIVISALVDEANPTRRLVDFGGGQSSWVETEPLPIPRRYHGAVNVGGELFAIGGDSSSTGSPAPSRITYHGPTTGAASRYAPSGNYRSPVLDTGGPWQIYQFAWSTVMTDAAALTLTMQYHTSSDGISWSSWSAPLASNGQQSTSLADPKSITYTLNVSARYFQYQAYFTTTNSTATPFLLESHVVVNIPPPDLAVSKSLAGASAVPGSVVTYTINYTNAGTYPSGGGVLTETIPVNTTYVNIGAGWNQVGASNLYTKAVAALSPGAFGAAQFAVQVNNSLPPGTLSITNTVIIGADPLESNFANNTFSLASSVLALVPGVDLRVTSVDDGVSTPAAGQVLSYTIGYFNYGTDPASGSVLTMTVPPGMSGIGGSGWVAMGGGAWQLSLGTLDSAQSGSATFSAQVNSGVAGASFLTTTARIGFAGADVDPSNNALSDTDYVAPGNLRVSKDDGHAAVASGQTLVYTITYENVGGALVSGIVVTDAPPLALVDVSNPGGWALVGSVYTTTAVPVSPGQSGIVTFSVQVKNGLASGTWLTNTAWVGSPADDQGQLADNVFRDADIVLPGGGPDLHILGATLVGDAITFRPTHMVVTATNSGPISTGTWFFLDLYIDQNPATRTQLGTTFTTLDSLAAGQTSVVVIPVTFDAPGLRQVYFQVDTCDQSGGGLCLDPSYGRVAESNEANNVFGPVYVDVKPVALYLPLIRR